MVADGLASNWIFSIVAVADNTVWVGTAEGVFYYDGQTWHVYTERDGLAGNIVLSALMTPDGAVWFGTTSGISRFMPPRLP